MGKRKGKTQHTAFNRKFIILSFFIVSFTSLTYQVIWLRLLMRIFGSSVYATSTLLTSFMAGLALGSFLGGIYIDKTDDTLEFYGKLLFSIGSIGIITHFGFGPLYKISVFLIGHFRESFLLSETQFILSFLIMIVPTTLIGGVFPVVNKLLVGGNIGSDVGFIYSANNVAAGIGSILTAFVFLAILGINKTIILFSLIIIASGAFFLFAEEKVR